MGLQDREYMRNRRPVEDSPSHSQRSSPRKFSRIYFKRSGSEYALLAIVLAVLVLAFVSKDYQKVFNCQNTSLAMDANHDGVFTYQDVGVAALQVLTLPVKVINQYPELTSIARFFELKKTDCINALGLGLSGSLLLVFLILLAYAVSLSLFLFRLVTKYIIFDLLKISPFGSISAFIFRHVYPRFVWLVKPSALVLLAVGLTAISILKLPTLQLRSGFDLSDITSIVQQIQTKFEKTYEISKAEEKPYVDLYRAHLTLLKKLDRHVESIATNQTNSVDDLADALVSGLSGDLEKAYAIYRWITSNIEYDTNAFFSKQYRGAESASSVLKYRKAVCDGYSELMVKLGQAAGLSVAKVIGYGKGYDYSIGEAPSTSNHAWNAVRIEGKWHLLDATWDSGSVNSGTKKFVKNKEDFSYFLVNPEYLIYSHYPELRRWQLMETAWTRDEFFAKVNANAKSFQSGLKVKNHINNTIKVNNPQYEFDFDSTTQISGSLVSGDNNVPGDWTLPVFDESGKARLLVSAPQQGNYNLSISTARDSSAQVFSGLLEYRLIFAATGNEFPTVFRPYFTSKVVLKTPINKTIKSNQVTSFKLSVNGAQSVFVYSSGKLVQPLRKEGGYFQGDVSLAGGDATLYASFDRSNELAGILKYAVR